MKTIEQTNKPRNTRKVRFNRYGNVIAYMGRYRVFDFGLDEIKNTNWELIEECHAELSKQTRKILKDDNAFSTSKYSSGYIGPVITNIGFLL